MLHELEARFDPILIPCWTPLGCKNNLWKACMQLPAGLWKSVRRHCKKNVLQECAGPASGAHGADRRRQQPAGLHHDLRAALLLACDALQAELGFHGCGGHLAGAHRRSDGTGPAS